MIRIQRRAVQSMAAACLMALATMLTGCTNFFVCDKASCTSNPTDPTGSDYAYVSNSSSASTSINGYTVASGTLVAATGSPYALTYTPTAMVVSRNNKFLYAGSNTGVPAASGTGVAEIYGYSIGTGGALTILNSKNPLINSQVAAMDVSPDGKWLIVASVYDGFNPITITEYSINSSTGILGFVQSTPVTTTTGVPAARAIKVAPSGNYVAIALGTAGFATFPFDTTSGAISTAEHLITFTNATDGAYDVDIDSNNNLFIAATGGAISYAVSTTGVPGSSQVSSATTAATGPFSVLVDGTSYVYSGATDASTGTSTSNVYGFSNTNGTLAQLTAAASTATASGVGRLRLESTGKYLLGLGYGANSGLQMFSIGTGGALTLTSSMPTGTDKNVPAVMALTH